MNREQVEAGIEQLEQGTLRHKELLDLFEDLTFREKWRRVFEGLRMPRESGPYKFAKLQLLRLLSPASAIVVPLLVFVLVVLLAGMVPEPQDRTPVTLLPTPPDSELDPIPPPTLEPPDPPDVVDVDFSPDPVRQPTPVAASPVADNPQPTGLQAVPITRSVLTIALHPPRGAKLREQALETGGGGGTEQVVLRALRWLKQNQREDGSWGSNRTAMTALALLTYLAHDETPASEEFGYTVQAAIEFLLAAQADDGRFRHADGHDYTTPIAAYALSEAYAMTRIPMLRYAAERSIAVIVRGQNKWGGFNYNLRGPEDERNDISYIAWCVQALTAARMALLEVDGLEAALARAVAGVKRNAQARDGYGGFGYTGPGTTGLTGAGALSLQFLGRPHDAETRAAINWLHQTARVAWHVEAIDAPHRRDPLYYWYYTTQVNFRQGGGMWDAWNAQFKPALTGNQQVIPSETSGYIDHLGHPRSTGFWEPPRGANMHGAANNPAYSTILSTLMLTVYYRYLPTFQPPAAIRDERGLEDEHDIRFNVVEAPIRSGRISG